MLHTQHTNNLYDVGKYRDTKKAKRKTQYGLPRNNGRARKKKEKTPS